MIKNFLTTEKQFEESSHGGDGPVDLYEIWSKSDFVSNVDFIDRVTVPPGTRVGYHQHGANEEMYILLDGHGVMTIEGTEHRVTKGDMILNPPFGSHGLLNDSDGDIELLVLQIAVPEKT